MATSAGVQKLLTALTNDLQEGSLTNAQRGDSLSQLKVYGRDPRDANALYSISGLNTICSFAFGRYPASVSYEALRCIANALLLQPQFRPLLAAPDKTKALADVYGVEENDAEFLAARILFLLTYGSKADFVDLLTSHKLIQSMNRHLSRHADTQSRQPSTTEAIEEMAMCESLKLVFNLASKYPNEIELLSTVCPSVLAILPHVTIPPAPLDAPVNTVVNALAILEFGIASTPSAKDQTIQMYTIALSKLVTVLEQAIQKYDHHQLDTQLIPLITVLRKIHDQCSSETKAQMRALLLPNDSERDLPLGKSSSLPSQLLRLTASPGLDNLPDALSSLMFEMSDRDASTYIKNIGYGYAAGYLMNHKIAIPENVKQSSDNRGPNQVPINPITGQRLDKEPISEMPEMTNEEKEREAERLFVLFERLKATGIVDVENPMRKAMEDGRFQEVDGSESD